MAQTDSGLPFSGSTAQSRFASHAGAVSAEKRALPQTIRLLQLLQAVHPNGYTDLEAANILELDRSSINARRVPLVKAGLVVPHGFRKGPTGVKNTVWTIAK